MAYSIIVSFRDTFKDEATEGAVIVFPDLMCPSMGHRVGLRQGAFQPTGEPKAISPSLEKVAPLFPIGMIEIKKKISRLGRIGHETLGDSNVTRGGTGPEPPEELEFEPFEVKLPV